MKIIKGNLLDIKGPAVLVQQVNCKGVMGAGLAKQIAEKWPKVKEDYIRFYRFQMKSAMEYSPMPSAEMLGRALMVVVDDVKQIAVANLFGQLEYGYGPDGKVPKHTDYPSLLSALERLADPMFRGASKTFSWPVYIPYGMGCGLGGGKWEHVEKLIEIALPDAIIVDPRS